MRIRRRIWYYLCLQALLLSGALVAQFRGDYEWTDYFVYVSVLFNAVTGLVILWRRQKSCVTVRIKCAALALTFAADTLLVLLDWYRSFGVFLFCCVQSLYAACIFIYRQSQGKACGKSAVIYWLSRLALFAVLAGAVLFFEGRSLLDILAAFSFSQLLLNVICAFADEWPSDRLFAIGLLLFLGCDVCVGLRNMAVPDYIQNAAFMLNWIFYLPSQMLIVLSVFREELKDKAQQVHVQSQSRFSE